MAPIWGLIPIVFLVRLAHEMGHILGGWFVGFDFSC